MTVGDETESSAGAGVAAAVLLPGDPRRIGGVRLLGRLGEGGMGTVYLGRTSGDGGNGHDGRLVAVKVIRADFARDERFRARFRAEARAAQRVARFCTAQVLDAGVDDGMAYLVTEYIDGPTLTAAVNREGPLRGSLLDSLAIGVAAALHGIHAAGVVHRDLKPSNVVLSRVGPKVIDFGIARAPDSLESLTDSGHIVGTPAYMAPEQFSGVATAACDVFSWGAVIAYAGTGLAPFGTGTPFEVMRRVTEAEPDLSGLDRPLRDLVARALDKRPDRRPAARTLLLSLVDDREDPVGASSRILSTAWEPVATTLVDLPPTTPDLPPTTPDLPPTTPDLPPTKLDVPPTKLDVAPTKLDTGPPRPRWQRRTNRWIPAAAALAAVAVVAVLVANKLPDGDADDPRTQPTSTPSATAQRTDPPVQQSKAVPGAPTTIAVGARVPANGFATLGVGEVAAYRFSVTTARAVFLQGFNCADLVPWTLTAVGAGPINSGSVSCHSEGPYALNAGQYELRFGGPGTEGKYAFQLASG